MKNKIITTLEHDIKWDLDGLTIPEAIEFLKGKLEDCGEDATIDMYREDYSSDEYDFRIIHTREETDEEAKQRENKVLAEFMRKKDAQKRADIAAYKQLQEKLGIS